MHSLPHPRPSPLADAGIRLPCFGPCDVGTYVHQDRRQILNFFKKCNFFKNDYYICFVLCPACILTVLC
ncbi:unnamed protein product, partial [Staurois parvus]